MNTLIAVVDDSSIMRKVVGIGLHRAGFAVQAFPNGLELLRHLAQPGARVPAGIILDIQMPYLDGYQLAYRLKTQPGYAHVVIILLSRHDGLFQRLRGRLAGANEYVTKPCPMHELVHLIESHLGVQDPTSSAPFQDFGDPASLLHPHLLSGIPLLDERVSRV